MAKLSEGALRQFTILVRYRTNSGCNAKNVVVDANSVSEAFKLASDKVRRMRGVVRIDGGEWSDGPMAASFPQS
jgi:hypothetical protein